MQSPLKPLALVIFIVASAAFAGCSSQVRTLPPPKAGATPLQAADSWFTAIDEKKLSITRADFESSERYMMNWGAGNSATWPTFSAVHCRTLSETTTDAWVSCSFHESHSAAVGQPGNIWTISMHRQASSPWLITNYGTG